MPGLLKSPENSPKKNQITQGPVIIEDIQIIDVHSLMHSRPENASPMQITVKTSRAPIFSNNNQPPRGLN